MNNLVERLGGAIKMAVNMLERDATPVRTEAAGALLAAYGAMVEQLESRLAQQGKEAEQKVSGLVATLNKPKCIDAYVRRLTMYVWEKHYKADSPNFEMLDDTHGVLTQLDNMLTGLTRAADPEMLVMNEDGFEWPIERRDDGKWQFATNGFGKRPVAADPAPCRHEWVKKEEGEPWLVCENCGADYSDPAQAEQASVLPPLPKHRGYVGPDEHYNRADMLAYARAAIQGAQKDQRITIGENDYTHDEILHRIVSLDAEAHAYHKQLEAASARIEELEAAQGAPHRTRIDEIFDDYAASQPSAQTEESA